MRQVQAEKAALKLDLSAARKLASQFEGRALGKALALDRAGVEVAELKAARTVVYEGSKMPVQEAVTRATRKIKARTVKMATADLSATAAQALPWIGAAVVVAPTAYDLKTSCDTMTDMHAIEVAVNPAAADEADVDRVCGMKVPTEAEVWASIKASPSVVWQAAKDTVEGLPSMPTMPEFSWPSLP